MKNLETVFEVMDALKGKLSGDYAKDLKKLNRRKLKCSAELYNLAYQTTQQP